jgi:hypothetical protein
MDIEHLTVETDPAFEDIRFLEDRLYAYHVQQAGVDERRWLAILVRDDPG